MIWDGVLQCGLIRCDTLDTVRYDIIQFGCCSHEFSSWIQENTTPSEGTTASIQCCFRKVLHRHPIDLHFWWQHQMKSDTGNGADQRQTHCLWRSQMENIEIWWKTTNLFLFFFLSDSDGTWFKRKREGWLDYTTLTFPRQLRKGRGLWRECHLSFSLLLLLCLHLLLLSLSLGSLICSWPIPMSSFRVQKSEALKWSNDAVRLSTRRSSSINHMRAHTSHPHIYISTIVTGRTNIED